MNWMIQSFDELDWDTGASLYWSNEMGWVSVEDADVFSPEDRNILNLPRQRCQWVETNQEVTVK